MHYVFNLEGENEILGVYHGTEEDVVVYMKPGSATCDSYEFGRAPADCVAVREVTREEVVEQIERFKRLLDSDVVGWLHGDFVTAMNSLMGLQAQMREYAYVMGARLNDDTATREVLRQVNEGRYIGARAHSRQFEDVLAGVTEPGEKW